MIKTENLLINVDYGLTAGKVIHNCSILCRKKKIYAIGGTSSFREAKYSHALDMTDCYAVPGFIDTHIYGFRKTSLLDSTDIDAVELMAKELPAHGTTTFIPTIPATSPELLYKALERISGNLKNCAAGADAPGIHLVGPFINKDRRGLVSKEGVRSFTEAELKKIIDAANNKLMMMTFAPETENAPLLIKQLIENDVIPSMGYSDSEHEDIIKAIDAGASHVSHLYNCMNPLHQRQIGLVSTALVNENLVCELIFDGYHIHPQMLDLACRAKGPSRISAVSVSNQGTGLPDGQYCLDGNEFNIENQHLSLPDGTIAGSMLTFEQAWQNTLRFTHMKETDAIACFTATPAASLKLNDRGHLSPGLRADIAIFNKQHELQATLIEGNIAYIKDEQLLRKIDDDLDT